MNRNRDAELGAWWSKHASGSLAQVDYAHGDQLRKLPQTWREHWLDRFCADGSCDGKHIAEVGIGGGLLGVVLLSGTAPKAGKYGNISAAHYSGIDVSGRQRKSSQDRLSSLFGNDSSRFAILDASTDLSALAPDVVVSLATIQSFPSLAYADEWLEQVNHCNASRLMLHVLVGNAACCHRNMSFDATLSPRIVQHATTLTTDYLLQRLTNYKLRWAVSHSNSSSGREPRKSYAKYHAFERRLPVHDQVRRQYWFHIPGTGTSFGATLLRHANATLPASFTMVGGIQSVFKHFPPTKYFASDGTIPSRISHTASSCCGEVIENIAATESKWPRPCCGLLSLAWGSHDALSARNYERYRGRLFGLFRTPELRLYSAYYNMGWARGNVTPSAYAEQTRGSAVKMLAGQASGVNCMFYQGDGSALPGCRHPRVEPDLPTALARLEGGFAFVGLTDEYALSVCLFHAMYGGTCEKAEFINARPSHGGAFEESTRPKTAAGGRAFFDGYVDSADSALFAAADRRFRADLARHNVTRERCAASLCPVKLNQYADSGAAPSKKSAAHAVQPGVSQQKQP